MDNTEMTLLLNAPAKLQLRLNDFSSDEMEQLFLILMKSEDTTVLNKEYDLMRAVAKRLTQEQLVNLAVKYGETQDLFCVYALQQINDLNILRELTEDPGVGEFARSTAGKRLRGETVQLELDYDDGNHGWQIQVHDDWVYYHAFYGFEKGIKAPLYKCRLDGSEKTKLIGSIAFYQIYKGWIYFSDDIECGKHGKGINKIQIDGSNIIKLCDDNNIGFIIADDWIYYNNQSQGVVPQLCKIRTDGAKQICISKEYVDYFNIDSGWIYYYSRFDENDREGFYKIRIDMTEKTKLHVSHTEFTKKEKWELPYISAGWVYDVDNAFGIARCGKLYRVRTDGTEKTLVCNDDGFSHCICGIWIYYVKSGYYGTLCRIRKDGTGREELCRY